jgi:hypothetical protein
VILTIAGAPGSGKSALAAGLRAAGVAVDDSVAPPLDFPLGADADYRAELWVAANRALHQADPAEGEGARTHSLLDSLAHVAANAGRTTLNPGVSQETKARWLMAATAVDQMLRDASPGPILFVRLGGEPEQFSLDVDEALRTVLEANEYTTLEAAPGSPEAVERVRALIG